MEMVSIRLTLPAPSSSSEYLSSAGQKSTPSSHGCNAHITGTGRQGMRAFLVEDGVAWPPAQTENALTNALAKLFGEPDGTSLGNGQASSLRASYSLRTFSWVWFWQFCGCCLHSGFGFFPLGLHVLFQCGLNCKGAVVRQFCVIPARSTL